MSRSRLFAMFAIGCCAVCETSRATTIFLEDFNTPTSGVADGVQFTTSLNVEYAAVFSSWTNAGFNSQHIVEHGTNDWAVMLASFSNPVDDNKLTLTTGIAANILGMTYQVAFDSATAVYQVPAQASTSAQQVKIDILDSSLASLASYTVAPGSFATEAVAGSPGSLPFTARSFTYTGNGNGSITILLGVNHSTGNGAAIFHGSIDNLQISSVPEPSTVGLMAIGVIGLLASARNMSRRTLNARRTIAPIALERCETQPHKSRPAL